VLVFGGKSGARQQVPVCLEFDEHSRED